MAKTNKNTKSAKIDNSNLTAQEINLENIVVTYNTRKYFDEKALNELADSINKVGVIQPITLRSLKDDSKKFEIICGERRFRASKIAGKTSIPAYIRECSDEERINIAFIENIQREDVNEIETAEAIKAVIDANKEDFKSVAARLGKSVKYVRDRYILNDLIDDIKALVINETLSIGKAILLASYNSEIQESVYSDYLDEEHWNNWLNISYAKFVKNLDDKLNTDLNKAEFDKTDCNSCSYNTGLTDLFSDENCNSKCLNKECFIKKAKDYSISKAIATIEQNPTYPIVKSYYIKDWLLDALVDNGFELIERSEFTYSSYPTEPEKPTITIPQKGDFIDNQKVLDRLGYMEALKDYRQELQIYKDDFKEYRTDIQEIELGINNGDFAYCFVIHDYNIELAYYSKIVESMYESKGNVREDSEIQKLEQKDQRNKEIKVENIVKDVKDKIVTPNIDLSEKEGVMLEQHILFFFLMNNTSSANINKWCEKSYLSDKEKYEFVTKLTAEQRTAIIRDYIISKLRDTAYSSNSVSSQLLLEFSKLHFEKETLEIEAQYQQVYDKRKKNIDARIESIKCEKLELKDTVQEVVISE